VVASRQGAIMRMDNNMKTYIMKKNVLLFLGIVISVMSYGLPPPYLELVNDGTNQPTFTAVHEGHTYKSISDYLIKSMEFPEGSMGFGLLGSEVVEFVVTADGGLTDYQVINSISTNIDEEVIRVLKETSGTWTPAIKNGRPVAMKSEVSVVFKPNDNYNLTEIAEKLGEKGAEELLVKMAPKKALKLYSRALLMRPYEEKFLAARSLCKYEMGDVQGARKDWDRIIYLSQSGNSQFKPANLDPALKHLQGYAQLSDLRP
jgi:hypothetical protein